VNAPTRTETTSAASVQRETLPAGAARKFMTAREAAAYLGKSLATLARWRCHQTGPEFHKSDTGGIYYPIEGLDKWVRGK